MLSQLHRLQTYSVESEDGCER